MRCGRPIVLALILVSALTLRLAWVLRLPSDVGSLSALPDQQEYLQLGRNLLNGGGLQFTDSRWNQQVWAYRTPGYPWLIAACDGDVRVVRVVQSMLDAASVLAVYLLARTWLGASTSMIAAGILAINPLSIYFSGLILSETLFTAMLLWGLVLLVRDGRGIVAGAIILALAVLVRPSAIALPMIVAVAIKGRKSLPLAALCGGLTLLVLFAWGLRNHHRLDAWVWTSTNAGITRYDGFNPGATGGSDQSFTREMPELADMNEVQRSAYLSGLAGQFMVAHPGRCLWLAAAKIGRLWSPAPLSRQFSRPIYVGVGLAYSLPLFFLVIIGLRGRQLGAAAKRLLLAPALYFTVIHAASVSSLRYRLPVEPLLAILAAGGVWGLIRSRMRTP